MPRMADLGRTRNHTFRRMARKRLHFENHSEAQLNAKLAHRFEIAWIEVPFGRTELEEYLVLRWRSTLWNKVARRLHTSEQYAWVQGAS